jgi:LPS-assembly protein
MIDGIGQVFTPFAQLRGDIYGVSGLEKGLDGSEDFVDDEKEGENAILRGVALGGVEYRYPFIAATGNITHVVEPIGQIIARPDTAGNQQEIPNEDAMS